VPIVLNLGNSTSWNPQGLSRAVMGLLYLHSLYKEPNIVEDIKIRRLGLAGRIVRMEEERFEKGF
jgi:hypothetical protein